VLVAVVMVAGCQTVGLSAAAVTAERRPSLLNDARWRHPESAVKFGQRFHQGVAEGELLSWLDAHHFETDRSKHEARRLTRGFPCNEAIHVSWTDDATGRIDAATAEVREAGCL
jgi:O-methyltransferase involved in polyketide biosynthesis